MLAWLGFFACTGAIVVSGTKLSKYGDIIAEKTGLGRAWVGLILIASTTSLPELMTGLSSVTYANAPDLAVGVWVGFDDNLPVGEEAPESGRRERGRDPARRCDAGGGRRSSARRARATNPTGPRRRRCDAP